MHLFSNKKIILYKKLNFVQQIVNNKIKFFAIGLLFIYIFFNLINNFIQKSNLKTNNKCLLAYHFLHNPNEKLSLSKNLKKFYSTNFVIDFYYEWRSRNLSLIQKHLNVIYCEKVQLTSPLQLLHNNFYWQVFPANQKQNKSETIFLYNAYYDNRNAKIPSVLIIAESKQHIRVSQNHFCCLLWFNSTSSAVLSQILFVYPLRQADEVKPTFFGLLFFICKIPNAYKQEVPRAISLQSNINKNCNCKNVELQPTNVLRVLKYDQKFKNLNLKMYLNSSLTTNLKSNQKSKISLTQNKHSIGVCVQALRFANYEYSVRMVEWLEMMQILGADKVYLYIHDASKSLKKVLKHYRKMGFVELVPLSMPANQLNVPLMYEYFHEKDHWQFWFQEHTELNDCLYRNLHRHDFIVNLDVDEIILLKVALTWHELLDSLKKNLSPKKFNKMDFFSNQNVQVSAVKKVTQFEVGKNVQTIPFYMYMAQHVHFYKPITIAFKSFRQVKRTFSVSNHGSLRCIRSTNTNHTEKLKNCLFHMISSNESILVHYRNAKKFKCVSKRLCGTRQDKTVWKYYDLLQQNVKLQLKNIFA